MFSFKRRINEKRACCFCTKLLIWFLRAIVFRGTYFVKRERDGKWWQWWGSASGRGISLLHVTQISLPSTHVSLKLTDNGKWLKGLLGHLKTYQVTGIVLHIRIFGFELTPPPSQRTHTYAHRRSRTHENDLTCLVFF